MNDIGSQMQAPEVIDQYRFWIIDYNYNTKYPNLLITFYNFNNLKLKLTLLFCPCLLNRRIKY